MAKALQRLSQSIDGEKDSWRRQRCSVEALMKNQHRLVKPGGVTSCDMWQATPPAVVGTMWSMPKVDLSCPEE